MQEHVISTTIVLLESNINSIKKSFDISIKICIVSSISDWFDEFMNYDKKKVPARYIIL